MRQREITPRQIEEYRRRNAIINGNFDFWQRRTSATFTGTPFSNSFETYVADRWKYAWDFDGGSPQEITSSRQAFVVGQTDVPNNPSYYIRSSTLSSFGANGSYQLNQRIEDVRTFAGQDISLTFWAKASLSRDIRTSFTQNHFAPGGEVKGLLITTHSLTTSWQKFTVSGTLPPTTSGSPFIGANNSLQISFWFVNKGTDATDNGFGSDLDEVISDVDIAQVQVEAGKAPSEFERRPLGEELALCQRYYQKSYPVDIDPGTLNQNNIGHPHFRADNSTWMVGDIRFPVVMRESPTIVIYQPDAGVANRIESVSEDDPGSGSPGDGVVSSVEAGVNGIALAHLTGNVLTDGTFYQFHYTADAEL